MLDGIRSIRLGFLRMSAGGGIARQNRMIREHQQYREPLLENSCKQRMR